MANYGGYDWDAIFAKTLQAEYLTDIASDPDDPDFLDEVIAERDPAFLELIDQWRANFPAEPA